MRDLKTIFGRQIQLKWNHYLQKMKMLNICYVSQMSFTKQGWIKALKDKKGKTVLNPFIVVNESNRKPNKLWIVRGREFFNILMQEWLKNNDILMYSTHNEVKTVITERFIKTLKGKVYKKMTANDSQSYLLYFNKLVYQYNNTCNLSVNKKSINADYSPSTGKTESNHKDSEFKVNDRVRIKK